MPGHERRNPGRGWGGPAESCSCPFCGKVEKKRPGVPCNSIKCSECGTALVRHVEGNR